MTELEFIAEISRHWPREISSSEPTSATLTLVNEAVASFPLSAKLWILRGCVLQLADGAMYPLQESGRCFVEAIRVDPSCAEANYELAKFLDSVMGKPRKAKQYFTKARLLRPAQAHRQLR